MKVDAPPPAVKGPALFQFPKQLKAGAKLPVHLTPSGLLHLKEMANHKMFDGEATIVRADATGLDVEMKYIWNLTASVRIAAVGNQIHCVIEHPNPDLKVKANDHDEFELSQPKVTPTGTTFTAGAHAMTDARKKTRRIKQQDLSVSWTATQLVARYNGYTVTVALDGAASHLDQFARQP